MKIQAKHLYIDESGSEMVEFALSLTVLLMAVFGILGFSLAIFTNHYVANDAREATRYAMVRGSSWAGTSCTTVSTFSCEATNANVQSYVQSITPTGITSSNLTVTTTWPGTTAAGSSCDTTEGSNSPGCLVMVKVSYPFNFLLPFLPNNTFSLSSISSVTIAQ